MSKLNKSFEMRFDKKFKPMGMIKRGEKLLAYSIDSDDAKAFLSEELSNQKKEMIERIEKITIPEEFKRMSDKEKFETYMNIFGIIGMSNKINEIIDILNSRKDKKV